MTDEPDRTLSPLEQTPTADITPLIAHIASLEAQVQRLTETATLWKVRAIQAEARLAERLTSDATEDRAVPPEQDARRVTFDSLPEKASRPEAAASIPDGRTLPVHGARAPQRGDTP